MKQSIGTVDATPKKRFLRSIIADYGLKTGTCELIDNAIDAWTRRGRKQTLRVTIRIDPDLRTIRIEDNAGGVPESQLAFIVGPGQTVNELDDPSIGLFGVGSKRAVVALAKDVSIMTRHQGEPTFLMEFDDDWIEHDESWELPKYKVTDIPEGETHILLKQLRISTEEGDVAALARHLSRVYGLYIDRHGVEIVVEPYASEPLEATLFEDWAYPKGYAPKDYVMELGDKVEGTVHARIRAGMTPHTNGGGEYGVYLYCNERLVFKEKKDHHVGYGTGLGGQQHINISPVRLIVQLSGPAGMMPWNSSKTDVNPAHRVFEQVRPHIVEYLATYNKVSRGFQGSFETHVFNHKAGTISEVKVKDVTAPKKTHLPKPPPSKPHYDDRVKKDNEILSKDKPWTRGLYEGVVAAEYVFRKTKLQQKNRMAIILLDSTLEIAFKEYLLHEAGIQMSDDKLRALFSNRVDVHARVKNEGPKLKKGVWTNIARFYKMRCSFVHTHADMTVHDDEVLGFRDLVAYVLKKLFKIKLDSLAP